jgi:hypothetical protein
MSEIFVDNIKHQSSQGSGTITLGASGETIALASGASVTGNGLVGITMADQFRLTTTFQGTNADITANLERVDDATFSKIGTGMTESSGIFTFPSTGTYLVTFNANFRRGFSDSIVNIVIEATTDNSSYGNVSSGYNNASTTTNGYNNVETKALINVTDISNVKVRFEFGSAESGSNNHFIHGSTGINSTLFTFIRLGDST